LVFWLPWAGQKIDDLLKDHFDVEIFKSAIYKVLYFKSTPLNKVAHMAGCSQQLSKQPSPPPLSSQCCGQSTKKLI
jgi:hypothetical protein